MSGIEKAKEADSRNIMNQRRCAATDPITKPHSVDIKLRKQTHKRLTVN